MNKARTLQVSTQMMMRYQKQSKEQPTFYIYTNTIWITHQRKKKEMMKECCLCVHNTLHLHEHFINYIYTDSTEAKQQQDQAMMDYTDNKNITNSSTSSLPLILSRTFVATTATEEEEEIAKKGQHPDGLTPKK
jgi:hypothetical protein